MWHYLKQHLKQNKYEFITRQIYKIFLIKININIY